MLRAIAIGFSLSLAATAGLREAAGASEPAWLVAGPGTTARVDIAPWPTSDEPEAALTESAASSAIDFTSAGLRPGDVRYEPIGILVRIERVLPGGRVARVHGLPGRWQAYAPLDRIVPNVPNGTALVAAGGFDGFADFYPALDTEEPRAARLATGSRIVVLGTGVAPYDPNSSNLVRLRVRVASGRSRGRTGWIAVAFTGLPLAHVPRTASVDERACGCRLIQFEPEKESRTVSSRSTVLVISPRGLRRLSP